MPKINYGKDEDNRIDDENVREFLSFQFTNNCINYII